MLSLPDGAIKASKYVIYVRKSTDDPQKQVRSIEDQLFECQQLAEKLDLNVVKVLREELSAKKPNRRPEFAKMIKMVEAGEVKGIIAWHPDRLARNMMDGGNIIQLVDDGKLIDLRFVSFPFSNDANGKMMIGIQFALSKHYSDKLSTDISRGNLHNLREGKSAGHYKAGYVRDSETGFYHPDPKNFDLIKKAWQMKLDGETETKIVDMLNRMGYRRVLKKKHPRRKKEQEMNKGKLNKLFADPIYYGILKQKGEEIDLMEFYEFETMVTAEQFQSVSKKRKNYLKEKVKHDFPFRGFVICAKCGRSRISAPSKGKTSHYLYLRCDTKGCPERGKSIRSKDIIDAIYKALKQGFDIKAIDKDKLRKSIGESRKEANKDVVMELNLLVGKLKTKEGVLNELISNFLEIGGTYGDDERKIYSEKKKKLETEIMATKTRIEELKSIKSSSDDAVETILNTLKKASESFLLGDHLVKDRIAKIVFLNTHVEDGKVLYLTAKPPFDQLLNHPLVSFGGA